MVWGGSSWTTIYRCDRPKDGPMVRALCQEWLAPWLQVTIDVFDAGAARSIRSFVPIDHSKLSETAPGENRRRATRHCRTPAPPQGARRRSPTTTVPLGTSTTPWYAPSPSFWSTWGRPKQDFPCVFARRARRANRAQSTAHTDHLPSLYARLLLGRGEQRAGTWGRGRFDV